jgi:hypothetical protein
MPALGTSPVGERNAETLASKVSDKAHPRK